MNPFCFVSTVQDTGDGIMVWGYFLATVVTQFKYQNPDAMIQNCVRGLYCTAFTSEDRCQSWELRSSSHFGKARKNRICLLCVNTRFVYCVYLFFALKHTAPAHSCMHEVYVVSYKYIAVILQITSFTVLLMFLCTSAILDH